MVANEGVLGFVFGGLSCMSAALVTHPVDTIKVRLQLQGELAKRTAGPATPLKYNGFISGMRTVVAEEGLRGLYKGLSASLLREATYSTLRMGLYEPFKNILKSPSEKKEPLWKKIIAAGASGMTGATICSPADMLKVRMQAQSSDIQQGLIQTFVNIWRTQGFKGLYQGVSANAQRAIVLTATQLPTYDYSKHVMLDSGFFHEGIWTHFVCSMWTGLVCATTTSPIDVVKSRYMNQHFNSNGVGEKYSSVLDCFAKTVKAEGIAGLYKGWLPQWFRIGPHTVVTFLVLEQLRRFAGIQPI
eukprot:jgi/Hompol1/4891/HPOL_001034-RA